MFAVSGAIFTQRRNPGKPGPAGNPYNRFESLATARFMRYLCLKYCDENIGIGGFDAWVAI
jgi:hypothetical protein